jgi:glycosyltransferase involved in cell wall biosynthesis
VRPVLIVSDHPALTRGFSVVGHNIALGMQARGWHVELFGRHAGPNAADGFPYRVHVLDAGDPLGNSSTNGGHVGDETTNSGLGTALPRRLEHERRVPLLVVGSPLDYSLLLHGLTRAGLRERVQLIGYVAVDAGPIPEEFLHEVAQADLLVPFTPFARDMLTRALERARIDDSSLTDPIPHGVSRVFRPVAASHREHFRRQKFGMADSGLVVSYFGRNAGHKRPDLVIRLFHAFAKGAYTICAACSATALDRLDPVRGTTTPADACRLCGSTDIRRGGRRPGDVLYLHTDQVPEQSLAVAGGWRLGEIAGRLGVGDQVVWPDPHKLGNGIPVEELRLLMSATDIHVLPYQQGGWELTVLEAAACGVPSVITDFSGPPCYARPFSEVVPVAGHRLDEIGLGGIIDLDWALGVLLRLANDPTRRRELGRRGVETAERYRWPRVCDRWHKLLTTVC